jgi:hypothetical protein
MFRYYYYYYYYYYYKAGLVACSTALLIYKNHHVAYVMQEHVKAQEDMRCDLLEQSKVQLEVMLVYSVNIQ